MNWGYKILVVYIVFIAVMLGMVYVASKQTNEMQDKDYYSKELAYQSVIDGKNNLNALTDKLNITNTTEAVTLKLPGGAVDDITEGSIYFLCPSDEKSDVREKLAVDANGIQSIPASKFRKGLYTVQISWKSKGKIYYNEQRFQVE
ncbi:MAG TPA: FixH family protein [Chitinophagales bacterium]|nr:FixH family protein [Chitinophagales bacterium]